ncbi:MAG TPA: DUF29 domain-containing protein [Falsiroseomonas sp.]|jgi:DnaJ-domain-containing protein 1|nr:DUF29 domain-containing protein [Falsiroseomonas sp.]
MDLPALYDDDLHAWALHQAAVLRRLKASRLPLPNDLDLEHVAEEIEDLGNEQRFQVEGNLEQALAHLIKAAVLAGDPAVPHWLVEVTAFLATAARRWRPSMRRAMDTPKLWADACHRAATELDLRGHPVPPLPRDMPFALEELVSGRAHPRDLSARMTAALADVGRDQGA